jgi:hypothetical protein
LPAFGASSASGITGPLPASPSRWTATDSIHRYRFERDSRKDNQLRRAGIEVMRIVRRELTDRSHGMIADVTRELTKRGL